MPAPTLNGDRPNSGNCSGPRKCWDRLKPVGSFRMRAEAVRTPLRNATPPLDERSIHLRRLVVRALEGGGRGHIGSSMSLIEIMRVLYDDVLRYRAADPKGDGRDRMILS